MKKRFKNSFSALALLSISLLSAPSLQAAAPSGEKSPGKKIAEEKKCAGCHNLTGPPVTTIEEILNKKGPDLFYAGNKFKKEFLVNFLQKPALIRPSGTVYLSNIKYNGVKDELLELTPCESKLSPEDAGLVSEYLLSLKVPVKNGSYTPKPFSVAKARIIFEKNLACQGCHKVREDNGKIVGGVSGTILYNAGERLKGEWVYRFLKNPQRWIPKIWMPSMPENEEHLQLITDYVMSMKR